MHVLKNHKFYYLDCLWLKYYSTTDIQIVTNLISAGSVKYLKSGWCITSVQKHLLKLKFQQLSIVYMIRRYYFVCGWILSSQNYSIDYEYLYINVKYNICYIITK